MVPTRFSHVALLSLATALLLIGLGRLPLGPAPRPAPAAAAPAAPRPAAGIVFQADFMPPAGATNPLALWTPLAGTWALHSAADTVLEHGDTHNGGILPDNARSANYYDVLGRGTQALLAAVQPLAAMCDVEAAVRTGPGEQGLAVHIHDASNFTAFTIACLPDGHTARLALWQRRGPAASRHEFAAAGTPLTTNQWVNLRVRAFPDRLEAWLDRCRVFDVPLPPVALQAATAATNAPGTRFGLWADGAAGARFDDVTARVNADLDLAAGCAALAAHACGGQGALLPRSGAGARVELRAKRAARWLAVGDPAHGPHVFSALFHPGGPRSEVGVLAGFTADAQPHYRFVRAATPTGEVFRLDLVAGPDVRQLETLARPPAPADAPARLMADASSPGELRLYCNDELVLIHHPPAPVGGASGLYVGAETRTAIAEPAYTFARDAVLLQTRHERNAIFLVDAYMRHWAAPEGQWIRFPNGHAWLTGDCFGRFAIRLPAVTNAEVHVGVPEGQSNGTWVVRIGAEALTLHAGTNGAALATVPLARLAPGTNGALRAFTLQRESDWLWATSGTNVLFKQPRARLGGTRVRVAGYTYDALKASHVTRYQVADYVFGEALQDWTINGGRWAVVNRYQCDPRWSHLNGESANGLAALWNKYVFSGDFSLELYGALRHPWYENCGDINVTILSPSGTPGEGYTATCSGWDPDRSQLFTRLYRNGALLAQTNMYMLPRTREGLRRGGYMPLTQHLDYANLHRAWFRITLRRIGTRLTYTFDNEPAIACEDPNPLEAGRAGIWTYLNSIVIPRCTVAASRITPRPLTLLPDPRTVPPPPPPPAPLPVLANGLPLDATAAPGWRCEDPAGQAWLAYAAAGGTSAPPALCVTTLLGGGPFFARCPLPAVPLNALAGWRFAAARTPRARFNLHYSLGHVRDGKYVPEGQGFHLLAGSAQTDATYALTGQTAVPPSPPGSNWMARANWTPVTVWLPATLPGLDPRDATLHVRLEGFGNLQPSDVHQGLTGNGPGAAYAVRSLTPIHAAPPTLLPVTNAPAAATWTLRDAHSGAALAGGTNLAPVQAWIAAGSVTGLVRTVLAAAAPAGRAAQPLWWVRPPRQPAVACGWSPVHPGTLDLRLIADAPDRRCATPAVQINGQAVTAAPDGPFAHLVAVPRTVPALTNLVVACAGEGWSRTVTLAPARRASAAPPILLRLEGAVTGCDTLENDAAVLFNRTTAQVAVETLGGEWGRVLLVRNTGTGQRLPSAFGTAGLSLANYPVMQFRYAAGILAQVTLRFESNLATVQLGEPGAVATAVRGSGALIRDDAWHTWYGVVADAASALPAAPNAWVPAYGGISSRAALNQTGWYTQLRLDDLVLGPAVAAPAQLSCTPVYHSLTPLRTVRAAVRAGAEPWDALAPASRQALAWRDTPPRTPLAPVLEGLPDGLAHLFVRAVDTDGRESAVTDIPFLLDRQPPVAQAVCVPTADIACNSNVLRLACASGGQSPLDVQRLRLAWNGAPLPIVSPGSTLTHTADADTLDINWPWICRTQLDQATNGLRSVLTLSDIHDGAGNRAADIGVPVVVNHATDHVPPTLIGTDYASNLLWCADWEEAAYKPRGRNARQLKFTGERPVALARAPGEEPYFATTVVAPAAGAPPIYDVWQDFDEAPWTPASHPFLALRLRRPNLLPAEPTRLALLLELDNGQTAALWLTEPVPDGKCVDIPLAVPWQSNAWHTVRADLRSVLQPKLAPDAWAKVKVKTLRLRALQARPGHILQLGSVFVFAPWQAGHRVGFDAFDTSGIGGLAWTYDNGAAGAALPAGTDVAGVSLEPATLPPPGADALWLAVRVKDKAGNASAPVRLPLPPRG